MLGVLIILVGEFEMKITYALTKENLILCGMYDAFNKLYCDFNDIQLNALTEIAQESRNNALNFDCIEKMHIKTNKKARSLFFDFFEQYSSFFDERFPTVRPNKELTRTVSIYDLKICTDQRTGHLSARLYKHTFNAFVKKLEDWTMKNKQIVCILSPVKRPPVIEYPL